MPQVKVSAILQLVKVLGTRDVVVDVPEGATVAELMKLLAQHADGEAVRLLFADPAGALQSSVSIMVNGRSVKFLDGIDTVLAQDDEVMILPAAGAA